MRDPLEEVEVGRRRAVGIAVGFVVLAVALGITRPSVFWTLMVILGFILMIVLHELGHFLTAKRTGMKASEFFVGFGPRIWSFRRGETEYGLKAVLLGGYVKIHGMTNIEDVPPEDEDRTYRSKSYPAKLLVASAGSAMHFVIAVVLAFILLAFAGDARDAEPLTTVGGLPESGSPALDAGVEVGDRILEVDGVAVPTWDDIVAVVRERPGEQVTVVVERDGAPVTLAVDLAARETVEGETIGYAGVAPEFRTEPLGVGRAAVQSPVFVYEVGRESVSALGRIFSPSGVRNYIDTVAGRNQGQPEELDRFVSPVGFGRIANQAVNAGWVETVVLLVLVNVFVGLFNLLPLLPFDGGHIAIATYERVASAVRGRRVVADVNKLVPLTVVVIGILGFIFLSSLFLDLSRPLDNPF